MTIRELELDWEVSSYNENTDCQLDYYMDLRKKVAGYEEAVKAFDEFTKNHKKFIGEFVKYRGDFISSDREAAAFMFTMEKYM